MINTKKLLDHFTKAGLKLVIEKKPLRSGRGMDEIIQIDIQRNLSGSNRHEWVRMYISEGDVLVQVRDKDAKLKQLVLLVREGETEFEEEVPVWTVRHQKQRHGEGWYSLFLKEHGLKPSDVVRKDLSRNSIVVRRKTTPATRCFLLGEDERQLFIAQLSENSTTVAAAHRSLGRTVQFAEGKRRGSSIDRQGEWFFLETKQDVRDHIETLIRKNRVVVHKKVPIGNFMNRGGQPHRVDELVVLAGAQATNKLSHGSPVRDRQVYIRGAVRHPDHKTQKFSQWREVVGNNEGATSQASALGVFWVD